MNTMDASIRYSGSSGGPTHAGSADDFGVGSVGKFTEEDLLALVEDADRQREYMAPWDHDQKLANDGWTTVYAIDADVFRFYGAPEDIARRQGSRLGYAEVFRRDADAGVRTLAYRLADYIFFELQPDYPLIVLPPIDEEVRRIIVALTMELGREPIPAPIDVQSVNELLQPLKGLPADAKIPEDELLRLGRMLGPRGLAHKQTNYLRLTYLLELRGVVASHSIVESDGFPGPVLEVSSSVRAEDAFEYARLLGEWLKRFTSGEMRGPAARRSSAWQYDASALARLELWNRQLSKKKCRLLYITGSAHVLAATGEYGTGEDNFRNRYVRHPRYFLASPDVVASTEPDVGGDGIMRSQFVDWVRTFLADIEDGRGKGEASSPQAEMVKRAFTRVSALGERLMKRWRRHMRSLSASYQPPSPVQKLFEEDYGRHSSPRLFNDWSDVLSFLEKRIEDMTDEAWEACFRSATRIGFFVFSAKAVGAKGLPPRLVPPLRFDSWPKTDAFVYRMAQWRNADDIDQKEYDSALESVRDETKKDYRYAYYLAHGALFAARGNWGIGAVLCKRALDQVKDVQPKRGSLGHGREARYLAAHCIRHTARSLRDLDEAENLLAAAKETYAAEIAIRPSLVALPERFEVEKLATQLTRYFFRLFGSQGRSDYREIISVARSDGILVSIRAAFIEIHDLIFRQENSFPGGSNTASIISCISHELVRIDANVLFLCIILDELHGPLADTFGSRLYKKQGPRSYYQDILGRLWKNTRMETPTSTTEIERLRRDISDVSVRRNIVLPYDGEKYRFLSSILEREKPSGSRRLGGMER